MTIRVYYLEVERIENTEKVRGIEYIHNAILECSEKPNVRKLIQDTIEAEHTALSALALEVRKPTPQEIEAFNTLPIPSPPARDLAKELDKLTEKVKKLEGKIK